MYTKEALLDIHTRCHRSLEMFFKHLETLSDEELRKELPGFGNGCILRQLEHLIGAEEYWLCVATDTKMRDIDDNAPPPSLEMQDKERQRIRDKTRAIINDTNESVLNERRTMTTFGGHEHALIPAQIIMRTQTHIFQHFGQISAICRLLGKPIPQGLDFPLRD